MCLAAKKGCEGLISSSCGNVQQYEGRFGSGMDDKLCTASLLLLKWLLDLIVFKSAVLRVSLCFFAWMVFNMLISVLDCY